MIICPMIPSRSRTWDTSGVGVRLLDTWPLFIICIVLLLWHPSPLSFRTTPCALSCCPTCSFYGWMGRGGHSMTIKLLCQPKVLSPLFLLFTETVGLWGLLGQRLGLGLDNFFSTYVWKVVLRFFHNLSFHNFVEAKLHLKTGQLKKASFIVNKTIKDGGISPWH